MARLPTAETWRACSKYGGTSWKASYMTRKPSLHAALFLQSEWSQPWMNMTDLVSQWSPSGAGGIHNTTDPALGRGYKWKPWGRCERSRTQGLCCGLIAKATGKFSWPCYWGSALMWYEVRVPWISGLYFLIKGSPRFTGWVAPHIHSSDHYLPVSQSGREAP